jgi:hypothetical protein
MTRVKAISFAEFQRFLNGLGFSEKRAQGAWVFHHNTEGLLVFRLYGPSDGVDEGDLRATRKFLDMRGLLDAKDFDAFVKGASAPA